MKYIIARILDFFSSPGYGGLMCNQRTYGRFRVLYSDGKLSQPMTYKVAKDYASMFDGKVILK